MKKIFTFLSAAVACLALTACNDPMKGDFLHTDNTISAIYMLPATGSSSVSISGKIDNEAGTIQFTIPRAKRKEIDRAAVKLRANVALDAYVTPPLTGIHDLESPMEITVTASMTGESRKYVLSASIEQ